MRKGISNSALQLTAIPLLFIAAGELGRYATINAEANILLNGQI